MKNLHISVFTNAGEHPLNKSFSLSQSGEILKESFGIMTRGTVETCTVKNLEELHQLHESFEPNQAIAIGINKTDCPNIVSKRYLEQYPLATNVIQRSKVFFPLQQNCESIAFFDHDGKLSMQEVRDTLISYHPAFSKCEMLIEKSSSSRVRIKGSTENLPSKGCHVFVRLAPNMCLKTIGKFIEYQSWTTGTGEIKVSEKDGKMYVRHLFDGSVYSGERLIFKAPPTITEDLELTESEYLYFEGGALSDDSFKLNTKQLDQLQELIDAEKKKLLPQSRKIKREFQKKEVARIVADTGRSEADVSKEVSLYQKTGVLYPEFELKSRKHGIVSAAYVLANIENFEDGLDEFVDPNQTHESDEYRAQVYVNSDGSIVIHSFRHGGVIYYITKPEKYIGEYDLTELGNAKRFADFACKTLKYSSGDKSWLEYDGKRWRLVSRKPYAEMTNLLGHMRRFSQSDEGCDELRAWQEKCETARMIDATIKLSTSFLETDFAKYDSDIYTLNCLNGMLDLRTYELLPHEPSQEVSKLSGVNYLTDATCEKWLVFMREFTCHDKELERYLQKLAGLCLTGDVSEQSLHILYGFGNNGKSLFLNVLLKLLGDYAVLLNHDFFLARSKDVTLEKMVLKAARLAIANELPEAGVLSENHVKEMIGNGVIKARAHYKDFVIFPETYKLVISTNHKPRVLGTDDGVWRRIKQISCDLKLEEHEVNRELINELLMELDGILNWAVEGLKMWKSEGLSMTARMKAEIAEYRQNEDVIGLFLDECTVRASSSHSINVQALYDAYEAWTKRSGEKAWAKKTFEKKIVERGFKGERRRFLNGIREYRYYGISFIGTLPVEYMTEYDTSLERLKSEALNIAITEAKKRSANDDVIDVLQKLEII
jgi:P4 family phage/plasmid primase-like protien